jgi:hypothetical protein
MPGGAARGTAPWNAELLSSAENLSYRWERNRGSGPGRDSTGTDAEPAVRSRGCSGAAPDFPVLRRFTT